MKSSLISLQGKFIAIDGGANGSASGSGGNTILMGQVVRPVVSGVAAPVLPSYSQAIGQTTAGATIVRTIRPAVHPSTAGAVKRTTETVAVNGLGGTQRFSLTVPALSALLAGTTTLLWILEVYLMRVFLLLFVYRICMASL